MNVHLQKSKIHNNSEIKISGSKSETNRLLLLQALYPEILLDNTSNSDDSEVMLAALKSNDSLIDIHHAGTAMRFLTAYFASVENREVTITGSPRMKERPIKILVDALRQLGAEILYTENEGFPPIKITGKKIIQNRITLAANVSSQYISALLLIAAHLENGIEITLEGEITSVPYIKMTLQLLKEIGIKTNFEGNKISVAREVEINAQTVTVESDWSSASYFYSIIALSEIGTRITLSSYKQTSFQGDSELATIYKDFGVETEFAENTITLRKTKQHLSAVKFELNNTPDIAQTIAATAFGLHINCHLTGLHTLKIKETDRLEALKTELTKLGAQISITDESLTLESSETFVEDVTIATYNDHRMAMAFAPLALKFPISIENAEVVSKSYIDFWNDLEKLGFRFTKLV